MNPTRDIRTVGCFARGKKKWATVRQCIGAKAGEDTAPGLTAVHARCARATTASVLKRLLLGAAFVGAAGSLAQAGTYTDSDEASLRSAIAAANADPDPTATITLTNSVAVSSATAFPAFTKPTTINTGAFTLSGADIASGAASGGGGTGLILDGGATFTNNGAVTGGEGGLEAFSTRGGARGTGAAVTASTITNAGDR